MISICWAETVVSAAVENPRPFAPGWAASEATARPATACRTCARDTLSCGFDRVAPSGRWGEAAGAAMIGSKRFEAWFLGFGARLSGQSLRTRVPGRRGLAAIVGNCPQGEAIRRAGKRGGKYAWRGARSVRREFFVDRETG